MVGTLIKAYKLKTVVMVQTADNAAVAGEALIWKAAVVASGAAVLSTIDTLSADTDFSGAASQAISQKSDAVFISMNGAVGARFVRALRERGYQGIVAAGFSISDTTLFSLAGSTLDKTIFPTPFFYGDPKSTEAANIFKIYKKKYNEEMAVFGGQGYSAAKLILSAMKISKTGSAADVTKALKRITRLETIYGPMVFSGGQGDYAVNQEATLAVWDSKGGQTKWVAPKK
jgi:ABC-type branched-subunit amino acid transport system substrate-binding protein